MAARAFFKKQLRPRPCSARDGLVQTAKWVGHECPTHMFLDIELALDRTGEGARPHMAYLTWPISIHVPAHAAVSGHRCRLLRFPQFADRASVASINKQLASFRSPVHSPAGREPVLRD